jgi:hypothetical protein
VQDTELAVLDDHGHDLATIDVTEVRGSCYGSATPANDVQK